jgi:hypothetical protein
LFFVLASSSSKINDLDDTISLGTSSEDDETAKKQKKRRPNPPPAPDQCYFRYPPPFDGGEMGEYSQFDFDSHLDVPNEWEELACDNENKADEVNQLVGAREAEVDDLKVK